MIALLAIAAFASIGFSTAALWRVQTMDLIPKQGNCYNHVVAVLLHLHLLVLQIPFVYDTPFDMLRTQFKD
jgi:hypothetical protein